MTVQKLIIRQKWEAMAEYVYIMLRHIPRTERFTLGAEIRGCVWRGLRFIIQANALRTGRIKILNNLDIEIQVLQGLIRTGKSLGIIPFKKYETSSRMMVEIGRMLGGWKKVSR
jgi:hypothetical protein